MLTDFGKDLRPLVSNNELLLLLDGVWQNIAKGMVIEMEKILRSIVKIDKKIIYWVQRHRNKVLDAFFVFVTHLGDNGFVWLWFAVYFILAQDNYTGETMITGLAFSTIFCLVFLKRIAKRKRPCDHDLTHLTIRRPSGHSFPSAHTSAAFAVAGVIYLTADPIFSIIAITLASLIAFSRIYLFVHYPSDVIAGVIMGVSFATLAVTAVTRIVAI